MKVLVFSEAFGAATTTFIHKQVIDVNKNATLLYVCNELQKPDDSLKIEVLPFKYPKLIDFIRLRLEWRDLYLNFYNAFLYLPSLVVFS